jgi:hypothetical protein
MRCIGVVDYDLPQGEVWNLKGDMRLSLENSKSQRAEVESHEKLNGALHKRPHQWDQVAMQANGAVVLYCIQGRHDLAPESIHLG